MRASVTLSKNVPVWHGGPVSCSYRSPAVLELAKLPSVMFGDRRQENLISLRWSDTTLCRTVSSGQLDLSAAGDSGDGNKDSNDHSVVSVQDPVQPVQSNVVPVLERVQSNVGPVLQRVQSNVGPVLERVQTNVNSLVQTVFSSRELSPEIVQDCNQEYEFSKKQENIFVELERAMLKCSSVLVYLALSDLLFGFIQYYSEEGALDLFSSCADAFHEVICAFMIRAGCRSFRAVYETRGHDIRNLLEGLLNLARVLQEVGILSGWLAMIQIATAAAMWTPITAVAAAVSVAITTVRLVTWGKPEFVDRIGEMVLEACEKVEEGIQWIFYLGGLLRQLAHKTLKPRVKAARQTSREFSRTASRKLQYEFTSAQEQVIRSVLVALRLCSLAKWCQGLSELMYLLASFMTGSYASALASFFDSMDALAVAGLLTLSMNSFNQIITTKGHDISLLLEGLGPQKGIAKFFQDYAEISLFLCLAQVGQSIFHLWYNMGMSLPGNVASWAGIITVTLGIVQQLV